MKFYEKDQTRYAIILAGGDGNRLSEVTRRITGDVTPKQFCPVIRNTSLLEQTRLRVSLAVDEDRILTVLTRSHEHYYRDLLKENSPGEPGDSAREPRNGPRNPVCTSAIGQSRLLCMCARDLNRVFPRWP